MSIDRHGNAWPGAGTTIYRNVTNERIEYKMLNVKVRELDFAMNLLVYDGGVTALRGTWEGPELIVARRDLPVTLKGEMRKVDDVVAVRARGRFVVVGSKEILPLQVNVDRREDKVHVDFVFGEPTALPNDDDQWPHVDQLTNTTFAVIYENKEDLLVRTGEWIEGSKPSFKLGAEKRVSARYDYHGVAGMDANHFIIGVTGRLHAANHTMPIIATCLCTIENGEVKVGEWQHLPWTVSHNYFDMDNFGPENVIMAFNDISTRGIRTVVVHFDRASNSIYYGAQQTIQTGGAILRENRIDLRILSPSSFAVFYEDNAIHGLVLVLCGLTPSFDIVKISPNYVVSRARGPGQDHSEYYYDLCESGWGDFMIAEFRNGGMRGRAMIHRGVVLPRMFGIAQKSEKGKVQVQFAGMFKVRGSRKLHPGNAVYTNSKGELVEGRPFGYVTRSFGSFYEVSRADGSILSQSNVIGIAVTSKKVYMKFL